MNKAISVGGASSERLETPHDFQDDLDAIARSSIVPIILETLCLATGMGFAAVARVTDKRWVACRTVDRIAFGLRPGDELDVESTLCHQVRASEREIVIEDVPADDLYCAHPAPARYGFRSYVSVPIHRADGSFFGTLCAIDPVPRKLKDKRVLDMFRLFATLVSEGLAAEDRQRASDLEARRATRMAILQEEFSAILSHDLRSPLAALQAGLRLIEPRIADDRSLRILRLMRGAALRMTDLVENLLAHARGRLGGGIVLDRRDDADIEAVLSQIIAEQRTITPERRIDARFELAAPVACDPARIGQVFSNLLGNAIAHGAPDAPVTVRARRLDGEFTLCVSNEGAPIPPEVAKVLFEPFVRGGDRPASQGLGLGLYIASQIALAHGGTIDVASTPEATTFTLRIPT